MAARSLGRHVHCRLLHGGSAEGLVTLSLSRGHESAGQAAFGAILILRAVLQRGCSGVEMACTLQVLAWW